MRIIIKCWLFFLNCVPNINSYYKIVLTE
jgi:hypothetical protein